MTVADRRLWERGDFRIGTRRFNIAYELGPDRFALVTGQTRLGLIPVGMSQIEFVEAIQRAFPTTVHVLWGT